MGAIASVSATAAVMAATTAQQRRQQLHLPGFLLRVFAFLLLAGSLEVEGRKLFGTSFGTPFNATYDYVVVGGGNAGLTMATRLAANGSFSVAVVEAGSFYEIGNGNLSEIPLYDARFTAKSPKDVNPLIDWGFVTEPQKGFLNASIHYARGKTLGGCTARNYMAYHHATAGAYQKWADQVGDQSYAYDKWQPFFKKSTKYTPADYRKRATNATAEVDEASLGRSGPLSVTVTNYAQPPSSWVQKAMQAVGIAPRRGFTSGALLGSSYLLDTVNAATQTRDSSETSFLRSSLVDDNLIVYPSTLAKRILFSPSMQAQGVVVQTDKLTYTLKANREVIVSAGAFQSPQLLMVSGVGPRDTLARNRIPVLVDRPGVGQNMWDHVFMGISYRWNMITASSLGNATFLDQANKAFVNQQSGILANPGGDFIAFEKAPKDLVTNATMSSLDAAFPSDWPAIEYLSMSGYLGFQNDYSQAPNDGYNYATVSAALVAPQSRGSVSILSADTADPPVINPNWLTHPADQALMLAGFKRVRQIFATEAIKPAIIGGESFPGRNVTSDADILDIIRRASSTVFHAAATCAMGRQGDPKAVVDSRARVFGTKGLRVVDASAFPFLPPGHPMATVYALAEKIAADILATTY